MKKSYRVKNKKLATVKTGSTKDFFSSVKSIMRSIDKDEKISESRTIIFEEPSEMLQFLSTTKMKLIIFIRKHPDSITNIAKAIKRNRASVYRDIHELERFGLVKMREEINPGHGRHKIVELAASSFKLEAVL